MMTGTHPWNKVSVDLRRHERLLKAKDTFFLDDRHIMAHPVTEIVTIPLPAGAEIEDPNSATGKVISDTLSTLTQQQGYQRAYYGRQIENPSILQIYVGKCENGSLCLVLECIDTLQIGTQSMLIRNSWASLIMGRLQSTSCPLSMVK